MPKPSGLVSVSVTYGSTCQNGKHERQEMFFLNNSPALPELFTRLDIVDYGTQFVKLQVRLTFTG
jgi:hypothetical protein